MDETSDISRIARLYDRFNARDIDGVLAALAEDIAWANAMEGGHVHGHAAVRDYWTRQWAIVSPRVDPLNFRRLADGGIGVEVRQSIYDLEGKPIAEMQGLADKTVWHLFRLRDGVVTRFDVADTIED